MTKFIDRIQESLKYIKLGTPRKNTSVKIIPLVRGEILDGHCILITGGDQAIGQSIARECLAEKAKVAILGTDIDAMKDFKESVASDRLFIVNRSLVETAKVWIIIKEAAEAMGGVDSLVHADFPAGGLDSLDTIPVGTWDKQMSEILRGVYFLTQSFVRFYTKSKYSSGKIIFGGSDRAFLGDDQPAGLANASRTSLMKGLAKKLILRGIRVNMLMLPADPGLSADQTADVAVFLLSDAANCISGTIVPCGIPSQIG